MKNISYFQPDLNLLYKELSNCSSILDEEHELYKLLVTYFAASVAENVEISLPD